jgi:hypothetical protein
MNMIQIVGIVFLIMFLWIVFEIWRAPLIRKNPDGTWIEVKPTKKISELFKKRKK